uniref:Uncharacterized protein n=1 Tax=Rhizophora mucronata TaxID=61149 RepID=A0A2P2Q357_RHIMU
MFLSTGQILLSRQLKERTRHIDCIFILHNYSHLGRFILGIKHKLFG